MLWQSEAQIRDVRLRDTGLLWCDGLRVIISTAEGLLLCLPDCYPLHHSEHASEACDILLTHHQQNKAKGTFLVFTITQRYYYNESLPLLECIFALWAIINFWIHFFVTFFLSFCVRERERGRETDSERQRVRVEQKRDSWLCAGRAWWDVHCLIISPATGLAS